MPPVEVWLHEKTGAFFLVGSEGDTVFGPVPPHQVVREYRRAVAPTEWVLREPGFYAFFETRPNPHSLSEWTRFELAWLPPSVTRRPIPDDPHAVIDWQPRTWSHPREDVLRLADVPEPWVVTEQATVGQLRGDFDLHPKGSAVVCNRPLAGETMAVIEWP